MKEKQFYGGLFLSAACILILSSCAKRTVASSEACKMREADFIKQLAYVHEGKNYPLANTSIWKYTQPAIQESGEAMFKDLHLLMPETTGTTGEEFFLVNFYLNKLISLDSSIHLQNIAAFSRFALRDKFIQHEFFQKRNGVFEKNNSLSIPITLISDNAVECIRNNIVFKDANSYTTVLSITNGKTVDYTMQNRNDYLYAAAKRYAEGNKTN